MVNIWHLNSHELQCTMDGHLSAVTSVALAANSLFAVSGSEDHTARVWGLTLGLVVSVFRVVIFDLCYFYDGLHLTVPDDFRAIKQP